MLITYLLLQRLPMTCSEFAAIAPPSDYSPRRGRRRRSARLSSRWVIEVLGD